jgi:hypothetical protein
MFVIICIYVLGKKRGVGSFNSPILLSESRITRIKYTHDNWHNNARSIVLLQTAGQIRGDPVTGDARLPGGVECAIKATDRCALATTVHDPKRKTK